MGFQPFQVEEQGSVTERHLLFAMAGKLIERYGQGERLLELLEGELSLALSPKVRSYLELCEHFGAISAYAYLEELFKVLTKLGFRSVTYMPNRNTPEQLACMQALCRRHGLLEISGVDIN